MSLSLKRPPPPPPPFTAQTLHHHRAVSLPPYPGLYPNDEVLAEMEDRVKGEIWRFTVGAGRLICFVGMAVACVGVWGAVKHPPTLRLLPRLDQTRIRRLRSDPHHDARSYGAQRPRSFRLIPLEFPIHTTRRSWVELLRFADEDDGEPVEWGKR
ncbi:hypothetical protein BT69DRAFT_513575 [Atractiella rhizophila]|nr:hypothetical protein BT69DRAFT_513575 [Atractiella rhizophila]